MLSELSKLWNWEFLWYRLAWHTHLGSKMSPKQFLKGDLSQRGAQLFHFHAQHSCCVHFSNTCGHLCTRAWAGLIVAEVTQHTGTVTVTLVIRASTLKNKQFVRVRKRHWKSFRVAAQQHNKTDAVLLNRLLKWLGLYLTARCQCNLLVLQQFLSFSQYIKRPTYM